MSEFESRIASKACEICHLEVVLGGAYHLKIRVRLLLRAWRLALLFLRLRVDTV